MDWQITDGRPVWLQLKEQITMGILTGTYPKGSRLPSVRELAMDAGVNPNTVQKALLLLEEEGLLYTKGTVGRFVTSNEEILRLTAERVRRGVIRRWLTEARELGMTTEEIIHYIQKEEEDL